MNQSGFNFGNHWNGRELRITEHASRELTVVKLDIYDLIPALDAAIRCPGIRRRRGKYSCCLNIHGTDYMVIVVKDVIRDFGFEPCWLVTHVKPFDWANM